MAHPPAILREKLAPYQFEAKFMLGWRLSHFYMNDEFARHFWYLTHKRKAVMNRYVTLTFGMLVYPTVGELDDFGMDAEKNVLVTNGGGVIAYDSKFPVETAFRRFEDALEILA